MAGRKRYDLWLKDYSADGKKLSVSRRYAAIKRKTSVDIKNIAHLTHLTERTIREIERLRAGEPIISVTLTAMVKYLSFCELDLFDVIVPIKEKERELEDAKPKSIKND